MSYAATACGDWVITLIQAQSGSPIVTVVDTYDASGRKIAQLRDALLSTYTYDAASRQTGQQAAGRWATFVYDSTDNVLVKWQQGSNPMSFAYDAANRIVTMLQGTSMTTYTYDDAGNMTLENLLGTLTSYSYDGENRMLVRQDSSGTIITNTYQADGLRRSVWNTGSTPTTTVWDGSDYLQERN